MIGSFIAGAAIGLIAGWAISSWRNARDNAPPVSRRAHWTAVGGNASTESVDAEWQQQIFRQIAKGRLFDIHRVIS
jgi:hypothetical protein